MEITKSLKRNWVTQADLEYAVVQRGRVAQNDFAQLKHGEGWKQHITEAWVLDDEARKKLLVIT